MYIAKALSTTGWTAVGEVVEIRHVKGVFEAFPFCFGEQIAKVRHTEVALFVGTDALHSKCVIGCECEVFAGILLHSGCGICQIFGYICKEISFSEISNYIVVVIGTAIIWSESVVFSATFWNDYYVEWSRGIGDVWIWHTLEAWPEESESPINFTVLYSRL